MADETRRTVRQLLAEAGYESRDHDQDVRSAIEDLLRLRKEVQRPAQMLNEAACYAADQGLRSFAYECAELAMRLRGVGRGSYDPGGCDD